MLYPTSSERAFLFLHTFANTCYDRSCYDQTCYGASYLVFHCGFYFPDEQREVFSHIQISVPSLTLSSSTLAQCTSPLWILIVSGKIVY